MIGSFRASRSPRCSGNAGAERDSLLPQVLSMSAVLFLLAVSFGLLAGEQGMSLWTTTAFSASVLGGAGQFAFLAVLSAGGSVWAATLSGLVLNARFLPLAMAAAPWIGRQAREVVAVHLIIEPSVGLGLAEEDPGRSRRAFLVSGAACLGSWTAGTAAGSLFGTLLPDPGLLGLDAALPCLLVGLLVPLVSRPGGRTVVLVAGGTGLAMTPFVPAGVPVLAGSAVAVAVYALVSRQGRTRGAR